MGGGGGGVTEPKQAAYDDEEEQQERMLGEPLLDDAWEAAACSDGAGIKARPKRPRSGRVRHGGGWAHTAYEEDEPLPDDVSSVVTGRFVISPSAARRLFATSRTATSASCAACGHANPTLVGQSIVLYCYHDQFATQNGKETQIMT